MSPLGRWRASGLRTRVTVLAGAAVAVALLAGAVLLLSVLRSGLTGAADERARQRIAEVERLVAEGRLPRVVPGSDPGVLVQVLDRSGAVVTASTGTSRAVPLLTPAELGQVVASGEAVEVGGDRVGFGDRLRVLAGRTDGGSTVVAAVPLTAVDDPLRLVRLALVTGLPLLLVAACGGVWLTVGRTLRPVEALRAGADEVTAADPQRRLPVPVAEDEVRRLAQTLNGMLDRLSAGGARERTFVADAAHELRSPLAALRTTLEVALTYPDPDEVEPVLRSAHDDVLRMGRLVEDLLLLARHGAPRAHSRPGTTDLEQVVRGVADTVGREHAARRSDGPSVALDLPAGPLLVAGARDPVERIVRNLLENALRHAATSVEVTVRAGGQAGRDRTGRGPVADQAGVVGEAELLVADDGPGIAPADRELVFERFTRLDAPRSRDAGGSGLGLAIVRELVRTLGGSVSIDTAPAGGALLRVVLPSGADPVVGGRGGSDAAGGGPTGPDAGRQPVSARRHPAGAG